MLRTKVGDCNEHTALYVALARALGIPARIAVGLAYVRGIQGAFYYHAWPEVYLEDGGRGLWLPVDPTFNQFPADATHVRLARGGLDKQAAILPMIGRLRMDVLDVELERRGDADSRRARGTMIAVHDLVKQYGRFTAVDHVNITVEPKGRFMASSGRTAPARRRRCG